jgi:hypothetical protein
VVPRVVSAEVHLSVPDEVSVGLEPRPQHDGEYAKQYRFGPADIYRAKQSGKTDDAIIKELLNPKWYFNSDPRTLPVYVIGSVCKAVSRVQSIRKSNEYTERRKF